MTRHGARVKIISTSPWPKPIKAPKPRVYVDGNYVARLKSLAADESALEREVGLLNGPQILHLGQIIGIPIAKNAKLASLRAQLINSLRSEIVWHGISGTAQPPSPGGADISGCRSRSTRIARVESYENRSSVAWMA